MTNDNNDLLAQIRSEVTDSDFVPESTERPKTPFYRVANRDPNKEYNEKNPFLPGIVIAKDQPPVESVHAVILFSNNARKWQKKVSGKMELACCSYDGLTPAPRIKEPACRKLDAAGVSAVLGKFRGYDEAKIQTTTNDLTEGTGKLQFCALRTKTGGIPICPKARYDEEEGKSGPCKPYVYAVGYDLERKTLFRMDISNSSLRAQKGDKPASPFLQYRAWLAQNRLPYYAIGVKLSAVKDGQFYTLNVSDFAPVAELEVRHQLKQMADAAKESYGRTAAFVPMTEEEKAKREEEEKTKQKFQPPAEFDDDDIPFN